MVVYLYIQSNLLRRQDRSSAGGLYDSLTNWSNFTPVSMKSRASLNFSAGITSMHRFGALDQQRDTLVWHGEWQEIAHNIKIRARYVVLRCAGCNDDHTLPQDWGAVVSICFTFLVNFATFHLKYILMFNLSKTFLKNGELNNKHKFLKHIKVEFSPSTSFLKAWNLRLTFSLSHSFSSFLQLWVSPNRSLWSNRLIQTHYFLTIVLKNSSHYSNTKI